MVDHGPRRSGRSTAMALTAIARAIELRGQRIRLVDHFATREADNHFTRMVAQLLMKLEFQGFVFENYKDTTYLIFKGI